MFGSQILEVATGIIFIYILVSIICSTVRESIEGILKTRAAYLEFGIRELLQDKKAEDIAHSLFNHPQVFGLFSADYKPSKSSKRPSIFGNGRGLPSYIPAKNFALAMMDIATRGAETNAVSSHPNAPVMSLANVRASILNIDNMAVRRALLSAIDSAQGDLERAQKNIEDWYDSAMDRISGWYKRSTQWIIFMIGLVIAVGLNVNTIDITKELYTNDGVREAVVSRADAFASDTASHQYDSARNELANLSLPIGWEAIEKPGENTRGGERIKAWVGIILLALPGWLLTAFAATMGAPFWFDLLNKIMVIRSTVKPKEKSPDEGSEDRQPSSSGNQPVMVMAMPAAAAGAPAHNFAAASPQPQAAEQHLDPESSIDGCDVQPDSITKDEDLPPAEGGVA